jgi:hypothetical protein
MPKDIDYDIENISFAEIEMIKCCLKCYVDEIIKRRLKSHILNKIINSAVSEYCNQIYDECKINEAEFYE